MSSTNPQLNERMHAGPQHHMHSDLEPIPSSKSGTTTVDYTPETIERMNLPPSEEGNTQDLTSGTRHHRHHDNLAQRDEGARYEKPSMGDKIVGKTEEIAGKLTGNPQVQQKGAQRAYGETTLT